MAYGQEWKRVIQPWCWARLLTGERRVPLPTAYVIRSHRRKGHLGQALGVGVWDP